MVHTRNEKEVPQTTRDLSDPVVALVGEQIEDASGNLHKTKDIVKGKQYSTHSLLTSITFLHVTSTCLLKILILLYSFIKARSLAWYVDSTLILISLRYSLACSYTIL